MPTDVIVLNGGSSSGKSSIARALQAALAQPWLTFGVDDLIEAMPPPETLTESGIDCAPDGGITIGPAFRSLEAAWYRGLAAMAGGGTGLIVDEVFLSGATSQDRLCAALGGLNVLWVGVYCDGAVATAREAARPDRVVGMAASQATLVHQGVRYDVTVDTTTTTSAQCARIIAEHLVT